MRYRGEVLKSRAYTTVTIPREGVEPLIFKVSSLPCGVIREYETICPKPDAPFTVSVTKSGEERKYNYEDTKFLRDFTEWNDLQKYYMVFKALEADENVSWNVKPVNMSTMREFVKELVEAGLSDGDVQMIFRKATDVSNITAKEVAEARKGF